jgi:hypothetical protein
MGNALEAMRIATTFFVLFYHAALSYLATPMRLTPWSVYDATGHVAFDYLVYWVNGFAMPVFFLANGVSAPAACEARGPRVFLTSRIRRLLRPLLFGCLTILPVFYLIWGYGRLVTGGLALEDILRWEFAPEVAHNAYGLGHLWFLEYLFLVCVLWCGGWRLGSWLRGRRASSMVTVTADPGQLGWIQRALHSPARPLWFAVPTALIFVVDSDTMLRVDNVIVPNLFRLLHYTYFFTVGGWIARTDDPRKRFIPYSTLYLVLSFVLFGAMSPLLLRHAALPLEGWPRITYAVLAALFPWLTVFGGLGVFMRVFQARGTVMRYLAESSFWLYLAHVPVIMLVQIVLLPRAWPAPVKFLSVASVAIAVSLASYEAMVRRSLLGEIINGARKRTVRRGVFGPEFGWIATLAVAGMLVVAGVWWSRVFLWGHNFYEEIPGQLYRSARLSGPALAALIEEKRLRTVVTFLNGPERSNWYTAQRRVCRAHGVALEAINMRADRLPTRAALVRVVELLDHSPRPLLVQEHRGIDQNALTTAVAQLLAGLPPQQALRQFDLKYFQFDGPEYSPLGQVLLSYQSWLSAQHWPHTPERFRAWATQEYLVHSFPRWPRDARASGGVLARGARDGVIAR